MKVQFSNHPLIRSIGLIRCDAKSAANIYLDWQNAILGKQGMKLEINEYSGAYADTLKRLQPLSSFRTKYAFISTASGWSSFRDNWIHGTDAASPLVVMSKLLSTVCIRIEHAEQNMNAKYSDASLHVNDTTILEVYENGNIRRSIAVACDDGKWIFDQYGVPFAFENTSSYKARRVSDRFNLDDLVRLLSQFDAYPYDNDWYCDHALIANKTGNLPKHTAKQYIEIL